MFDVGGGELLLIVIAILLLFGPEKLPELARSFGKGMSHLRKAQTEFQRNLNAMADEVDEIVQKQPESSASESGVSERGASVNAELPTFERYIDSYPQDTAQTPFDAHLTSSGVTGTDTSQVDSSTANSFDTNSFDTNSSDISSAIKEHTRPTLTIRPAEHSVSTDGTSAV